MSKNAYNAPAKRWQRMTAIALTLWLLLNVTGCGWLCRDTYKDGLIVINGEEKILVRKATLDQLYADNEKLIRAVEVCKQW